MTASGHPVGGQKWPFLPQTEAFVDVFDGPIVVIPQSIEDVNIESVYIGRDHFGMDERCFYFMFSFDYNSSPFRKNALGVLTAFHQAFPFKHADVRLIIKSTGVSREFLAIRDRIEKIAREDPRIFILNRNMRRDEMLGLIRCCDAYISLHRAEGFGLGMAEAMMFERVVIGTDYSGSREFLTEETGYPAPYVLRPVEPHEYRYWEGQFWAEPDLDEAARIMRHVVAGRSETACRGRMARKRILLSYSPEAVGKVMQLRLEELFSRLDA